MIFAIVCWSFGFAAMGVAFAATLSAGDLIKASGAAVYYYGDDGKRYVFPTESTYMSWYADFSDVKTITDAELAAIDIGGNATVRPGTKLVKINTDPKTYAVSTGGVLRHVDSEVRAVTLYGADWNTRIVDIPESFWVNYTAGDAISSDFHPDGALVKYADASTVYLIEDGVKRAVTGDGFTANRFKDADVITIADAVSYSDGAGVTEKEASANVDGGVATTPTTGTGLTVALASDTPGSATLPDGATGVVMAKFSVSASSDGDVTIQTVTTTRGGIGTTSELAKVYLYDGDTRLTNGKTVNSTTNETLFTNLGYVVPAGTTKVLSIVCDIADSANGNHSIGISSLDGITTDGATVSGSFPISGNTMSVSGVFIGTAITARAGSASYTRTIGELEQVVSKFSVQTAKEDTELQRLTIYSDGNDILNNMKLYRGSELLAEAVEGGRYFTFSLDTPNLIEKGDKITYTLKADIVSDNASNSTNLYIRYDSDLRVVGKTYGYGVDITNTAFDGSNADEKTAIALEAGEVTVVSTGPNASEVVQDANDVVLLSLNFSALAETKVEAMDFNLTADTVIDFENLEFYCEGLGLIETWSGNAAASNASTEEWNIGAGETVSCELRVDVKSTATADGTIRGVLEIGNWTFRDVGTDTAVVAANIVPSTNITGYAMTVKAPSLTVVSATNPSSQSWVKGESDVSTAGFVFTAGEAADMKVQDVTVTACYGTVADSAGKCALHADNLAQDTVLAVSLYDGDTKIAGPKSISSTGLAEFTDIGWVIDHGTSKTLTAKADLNTTLPNNVTAYISLGIQASGVTAEYNDKTYSTAVPSANRNCDNGTSGTYDLDAGTYQTIRSNGTLAVDVPSNTYNTDIAIAGASSVDFSKIKFTSAYEDMVINKLVLKNDYTSTVGDYDNNIANVYVTYPTNGSGSATETKECTLTTGIATCTGLNIFVPNPDITGYNNYAIVEVTANMQTIAGGALAANAPAFTLSLNGDFEAIGASSGAKIYEETLTITDAVSAATIGIIGSIGATGTSLTASTTVAAKVVVGDIIKMDDEEMYVSAISSNGLTITVIRNVNGTSIAVHSEDTIYVYGTADATLDTMAVNAMNVQGTKLTLAAQTPAHGGQNSAEEVMKFGVTADSMGDAEIRQGKTFVTAVAGVGGVASSTVANNETTIDLDAASTKWTLTDAIAGNSIYFDAGAAGIIDDYTRVSFWIYTDDAGEDAVDKANIVVSATSTTDAVGTATTAIGTGDITDNVWTFIDMAMPTADADARYFHIELNAVGDLIDADFIVIDDLKFYNEKVIVDLTSNKDQVAGTGVSTFVSNIAYLKQNGTTVATGYSVWYNDAGLTGTLSFVPTGTYSNIEISGTDTFTIEMDTTTFTDVGADVETITLTIDEGNSVSGNEGDLYWYDVEGADSVPYTGVNATDKISSTISY